VKDFLETFRINPNTAVFDLKTRIYNAILPLIINIKSKKYYDEFERIRETYGKHFLKRKNIKHSVLNLFKSDQQLTNKLDELEVLQPEETEQLAIRVNNFCKKVNNLGLKSWLITENEYPFGKRVLQFLLLLSGIPVFLYGFLFNAIPFFLIDRVIRKKVKNVSFWSTFFLVAGIIVFPVFYLLELLAVSWLLPGFWLQVAFLISLPFAGKVAFKWYILLRKTIGRCRLLRLKWFNKEKYHQLLSEKGKLFEKLDQLISL
jgi:hypothetical protein